MQRVSRSGRFLPTRTTREIVSSLLRPNEGLRFFDPSLRINRAIDDGLRDVGSISDLIYIGQDITASELLNSRSAKNTFQPGVLD